MKRRSYVRVPACRLSLSGAALVLLAAFVASCGGVSDDESAPGDDIEKDVGVCEVKMPSSPYDIDSAPVFSCWTDSWDKAGAQARCNSQYGIDRIWWANANCADLGYSIDNGNGFYYASDDHMTGGSCGTWGSGTADCAGGSSGGDTAGNPCTSAYCNDLLKNLKDKQACDVSSQSVPDQTTPFNQRDSLLTAAQLLCWTAGCIDAQRDIVEKNYGYSDAQIDASLADYCSSIDTNVQNALALCSDALCLGNASCGDGACDATCTTCCWGGSLACK